MSKKSLRLARILRKLQDRRLRKVKTNHVQDGSRPIYCHRRREIQDFLSKEFFEDNCLSGCPFFEGTYQGQGIECKYYDGSNNPIELVRDAKELADRSSNL